MKPETERIAAALTSLTEDLYYSLVGDEPYVVVVWDSEEKGEWTLLNFLRDRQALTLFEPEAFLNQIRQIQTQAVSQQYQALVKLLQENVSELRIYGYGFPKLPEDLFGGELPIAEEERDRLGVPLLIGELVTGEWIGLAPKQERGADSSLKLGLANRESIALVEQVQSLTGAIAHQMKSRSWRLSESWVVVATGDRHSVIERLLVAAKFLSIDEINTFFRSVEAELEEFEEGEELPEDLQKSIALRDYFQSQLQQSQTYNLDYIIGGERFSVHYLLGKTSTGDWAGVVTDSFTF